MPAETPTAAVPPTPTPPPTFGADARIAGVDVAGMTEAEARAALDAQLAPLLSRPLDVRAGPVALTLKADEIGLRLPADELVGEASALASAGQSVRVPLRVSYDQARVRGELERVAAQIDQPGELLVASETLSRSFVYRPARSLDVDAALAQIEERLQSPNGDRRLTLLVDEPPSAPADLDALLAEVEALAADWDGVVGFYLYDFNSGNEIGLNQHSIFSGASVMKVPIMLQVFLSLDDLNAEERGWLTKMIVESDNLAANELLARIVGGVGTEDALAGVMLVNETLRSLGLPYTYQSLPYESGDFLIDTLGKDIYAGPALDGPAPQTAADPYLRTTPLEMGRMMAMIAQCSRGEGELLRRYPTQLSAEDCGEMIALLRKNKDTSRIVAGLPRNTSVAHKSGWVEDMQADVAYIESPGGDFVTAIYLYRTINIEENYLADEVATPVLASFGRLVYSAYNPTPLD